MEALEDVLNQLREEEEAKAIGDSLALMKSKFLGADLAYISMHLSFLPQTIKVLEEEGLPLRKPVPLMEEAMQKLQDIPAGRGRILSAKLESVLERKPGYETGQAVD